MKTRAPPRSRAGTTRTPSTPTLRSAQWPFTSKPSQWKNLGRYELFTNHLAMATAVTASGAWSTTCRRYPHASTHASISSRARVSRVDHGQPDPKGEALASWLRTHDGFDELGVRVRFMGEARGFAGVAVDGVEEGDLLVRVPRSAMLTADDARSCPIVGDVASQVSDTAALALKLLAERDAAGKSAWSAWIATLPTWEAVRETHPLAWSRERRERALRGSPTLTRLAPPNAETRRRPIEEPHPRGVERQLPPAHQRRRAQGTPPRPRVSPPRPGAQMTNVRRPRCGFANRPRADASTEA